MSRLVKRQGRVKPVENPPGQGRAPSGQGGQPRPNRAYPPAYKSRLGQHAPGNAHRADHDAGRAQKQPRTHAQKDGEEPERGAHTHRERMPVTDK